jgi:hypothetical protein
MARRNSGGTQSAGSKRDCQAADLLGYRSPGYWDIVSGTRRRWLDPHCKAREQAYWKIRDEIFQRWKWKFTHGSRPSAWHDFEAPKLAKTKGISGARLAAMSAEEAVYHLTEDDGEREYIRRRWARNIQHARRFQPDDWRAQAVKGWEVPRWFVEIVSETASDCGEVRSTPPADPLKPNLKISPQKSIRSALPGRRSTGSARLD